MKRRLISGAAVAIVLALATTVPAALEASAGTRGDGPPPTIHTSRNADLSLVHGIPGVTVDIYLVKNLVSVRTLRAVPFGTAVDLGDAEPGWVTPGFYLVDIVPTGTTPFKPLLFATTYVGPGQSKTVAAYVTADSSGQPGQPKLGVFTNDRSFTSGQSRVTVRHLAVAPTVGVYANGAVALTPAFSNGQSATATVPSGSYDVTVTAPNQASTVLADLGPVPLEPNTTTLAFAIGTYPSTFTVKTLTVGNVR